MAWMMQTLHLVDASHYVFRAWHSLPPKVHRCARCRSMLHGFARFLLELLGASSRLAKGLRRIAGSSFRNELYPPYKGNREPHLRTETPVPAVPAFAAALGLTVLVDARTKPTT